MVLAAWNLRRAILRIITLAHRDRKWRESPSGPSGKAFSPGGEQLTRICPEHKQQETFSRNKKKLALVKAVCGVSNMVETAINLSLVALMSQLCSSSALRNDETRYLVTFPPRSEGKFEKNKETCRRPDVLNDFLSRWTFVSSTFSRIIPISCISVKHKSSRKQ